MFVFLLDLPTLTCCQINK